jgi:hypothetical protein
MTRRAGERLSSIDIGTDALRCDEFSFILREEFVHIVESFQKDHRFPQEYSALTKGKFSATQKTNLQPA